MADSFIRQVVNELADPHGLRQARSDVESDLARVRQQRDDYAAELARITGADARERLARHLWLDSRPNDPYAAAHWQAGDSFVNKEPWRRKADAALAVIAGKEK